MNFSNNNLIINLNSNSANTFFQNEHKILSENNKRQIALINSFSTLPQNWDSYDANVPSNKAISKSVAFVKYLSDKNIEVYFTAPTPDGDIVVEIRKNLAQLEFVFSQIDTEDKVIASYDGDFSSEAKINDTTNYAYLKWLICPNGDCPNF
ncbi:MAG: hypothetical protein RLZZ546_3002 [Bacteroidota bacterium]|jgi:predicted secreted acid phosphatase